MSQNANDSCYLRSIFNRERPVVGDSSRFAYFAVYHRRITRIVGRLHCLGATNALKPLSEENQAVDLMTDLIGEVVILAVLGACLRNEIRRQQRNKRAGGDATSPTRESRVATRRTLVDDRRVDGGDRFDDAQLTGSVGDRRSASEPCRRRRRIGRRIKYRCRWRR